MPIFNRFLIVSLLLSTLLQSAYAGPGHHDAKAHSAEEAAEGRVELSERMFKLSGLKTELAGKRRLAQRVHLFGVIALDPRGQYQVQSPYAAQVQQVLVELGQQVEKGQPLLKLLNTTTLQAFTLTAPARGVITKWQVNQGQVVGSESLLEIADFSRVFVELSAFPSDLQQLKLGQQVTVFNLHHRQSAQSNLSFIAPAMTDGHIARARAVIDNSDGLWRPGMHVKADILVAEREVAIAVRKSAIQSFRDMPVVFARIGNTFEVRMPEFGFEDDDYIEVLSGLKPGTEYATDNSYLLKADVEKDGASHDH